MKKALILVYGIFSYVAFLAVFVYFVAFVGDFAVPKTVNSGPTTGLLRAILIDTGLVALFAIQHLVMARQGFKRWWTRIVPEPMERSTFVLAANLALAAIMWFWQPIPLTVWKMEQPLLQWALFGVFWAGWGMVLVSTFLIDHFDLFGLRQAYCYFRSRTCAPVPFKVRSLYRVVRHPMMLGLLLAFWSTPVMTVGHLVLALGFTSFIFVGLRFEERDLSRAFGRAYEEYRQQTWMVLPLRRGRPSDPAATPGAPRTEESYGCVTEPC